MEQEIGAVYTLQLAPLILVLNMYERIYEQPPTKIYARNLPRGAPRGPKGCSASAKPPHGYKIHIFGDNKLKFGM